jgi:single-stranded DNA-specific DHH superfamily exonuclease
MAEKINLKNEVRKQFDTDITEEAIAMIENNEALRSAKSTVLFKNTWHKGVIGIVAARCVEKYYRPTVILTESNNKITGSARSVHDSTFTTQFLNAVIFSRSLEATSTPRALRWTLTTLNYSRRSLKEWSLHQ